ncbi:MAG: acyltransferase family protein [Pseudomonadota bacterium]
MIQSHTANEPRLDGFRGLAILTVIIFHSAWIPVMSFLDKLFHTAALSGWVGVDFFFVLSGFLITRSLLKTKEHPNFFFNFYMRRTLRIFPLYYLFLILFFYVIPQSVSFGFTYWTFLSNILLGRLAHFQSSVLDVSWSLAVEEQFYLLWPLVVWSFKKENLSKVAVVLFLVSLVARLGLFWTGAVPMKNYVLLVCRMDSLCAGAWLACRLNSLSPQFLRNMVYLMTIISGCFFAWDVGLDSISMRTFGFSANALLAASVIGILCKKEFPSLNTVFESRFLRMCGKYSFGMYLFHVPVIGWLFSQANYFWNTSGQKLGIGLPIQILFHGASILATLFVAMIFYHGYEKHFLKLKKYFEARPELVSPLPT